VSRRGRTPPPGAHFRVTIADLVGDRATVVLDATEAGFHAAVGDDDGDHLLVQHGIGGDPTYWSTWPN
jgi:hypothetical protein